jgi:hypothetical protein
VPLKAKRKVESYCTRERLFLSLDREGKPIILVVEQERPEMEPRILRLLSGVDIEGP